MGTNMPTTPVRPSVANAHTTNTPHSHKQSTVFHSSQFTLDASRAATLHDVGRTIPEVSFQFLQDNVLPVLRPNLDVPKVVQRLKDAQVIVSDRWSVFGVNPSDDPALENVVFAKLSDVISSITAHSQDLTDAAIGVEYANKPNEEPLCDYVEKGNHPDGYLLLKNRLETTATRCHWRDICTAAEFKKENTDKNLKDDVNKICWSMHQMMHEDARRRFVYAFTIEDTIMRVWFASRAEMIVSEPFDFMKDHAKVVHFFLSQLYAEDHELGIDDTMTLIAAEKGKKPVYDITVQVSAKESIVYRTKDLLDEANAAAIRGRGTRVWDVYNLNDPDQTGVLKDSWVDADRMREGNVLEQLASHEMSERDQAIFDACFLTILAQGDVVIHGVVDNTRTLMTRGAKPVADNTFNLRVPTSHPAPADDPDVPKVEAVHGAPVDYPPKTRYRIVFMEKCTPLYKEKSLASAFKHLMWTVGALQVMHENGSGWVHRDLSTGNVLIGEDGQTKLADLEYAKSLDDTTCHNVRTGTLNFMAAEVDAGCYLFRKKMIVKKKIEDPFISNFDLLDEMLKTQEGHTQADPTPLISQPSKHAERPAFRHNPLHDIESVWWMALELLINRERSLLAAVASRLSKFKTSDVELSIVERKYARSVFYNKAERQTVIAHDSPRLNDALDALPESIHFIGVELLELRDALVDAYETVENKGLKAIGKGACEPALYKLFAATLKKLATSILANVGDILLEPLPPSPSQVEKYNHKDRYALGKRGVVGAPNASQAPRGSGKRKSASAGPRSQSKKTKV